MKNENLTIRKKSRQIEKKETRLGYRQLFIIQNEKDKTMYQVIFNTQRAVNFVSSKGKDSLGILPLSVLTSRFGDICGFFGPMIYGHKITGSPPACQSGPMGRINCN